MMLMAVGILGAVGAGGATILYFIGQKFKVYEDPRIEPVQDALPGVNCGACGFPGCNSFADGGTVLKDFVVMCVSRRKRKDKDTC